MDLLVLLYFGYCFYDAYLKTRTNVAAIKAGEPVVFDNGDSFLAWSLRALLRTLWAGAGEGARRARDEIGRRRAAKRETTAAGERLGWRERLWPPSPDGDDAPRLETGRTDDPPDTDDHSLDDHPRTGRGDLPGDPDGHAPGDDHDPADRDDLPGDPDDLRRRSGDDHHPRRADDHRPAGGDDHGSAGDGRGPGRCAAGCGAPAPAGAAVCAACAARRERQREEWVSGRLYLHADADERDRVMLAFGAGRPVDEELWRRLQARRAAAGTPAPPTPVGPKTPAAADPEAAGGQARAEAPVFGGQARAPADTPGAGPVGPCPTCGAAGVVRWSTDTLTGTVECPDCRGTGKAGATPLRATSREIEDAIDRFGRRRFTDDDLAVARGGGCTHQTRAGLPGDGLCGNPLLPGSVYCAEHVGWDDSADWGDLGVTPDEPAAAADGLGSAAPGAPSPAPVAGAPAGVEAPVFGQHPRPAQPGPAAGGAPVPAARAAPAAGPAGPPRPGRPHLTLVQAPRTADGRAEKKGGAPAPGAAPRSGRPRPGAGPHQHPGGMNTVTITSSGETTNISSARDYYGELGTHVEADILSQIELSESTLTAAEMGDPKVMGAIAAAAEQFALARDAAAAVVAALETHRQMEEAVQATPGAARTGFYREDGSA